ncbi:MAE_28990/MAE_18760 family HEPN-like nuclease [Treponema berlinense]|uniref:MAE_28990/MAE_18760 family HEPN-like nuclease n=1 Tax=Treponema berlinense TaxID=225004 RepID=UPI0026F1B1BE|nr:MAE_28990/MAE_18760 family HEPN-like nuclease [Treponema berlinense]
MVTDAFSYLDLCKTEIDSMIAGLAFQKVNLSAITKACIVLMTYNMIEGSYSVLMQDFFDYLRSNIGIVLSNSALKNQILKYHLNSINKDLKKFDNFCSHLPFEIPSYEKFKKQIQLYSGNLDAKEIRNVSNAFDVSYVGIANDKLLLYVKNTRNKLTHGELRYSEACRDKTDREIKECVDASYSYMKRVFNGFVQKYS